MDNNYRRLKLFTKFSVGFMAFIMIISYILPYCSIITENVSAGAAQQEEAAEASDEGGEFQAVWISYWDFSADGYTEDDFKAHIDEMFTNVADMGMNAVVVQVRPFGDAMYPSKYFPWSKYVSGKQGVNPGYDPLKYMVEKAHALGLEFHAWINPYRVANDTTDITSLSVKNKARIWLTDDKTSNDRNVLIFDGGIYYNPAKSAVRTLIADGVKEIIENYDVDDYFYPALGSDYKNEFDSTEYGTYKAAKINAGKSYYGIIKWRRQQVNLLLKKVYSTVKSVNSDVVFGVAPQGNMDNLYASDRYYCDVKKWMSSAGYVDYICPEIYWSFEHPSCPYDECLDTWTSALSDESSVKLYAGVPVYKAGTSLSNEPDFKSNSAVLVNMLAYGRLTGKVSGYIYYDYSDFYRSEAKSAVKKLLKYL
jgi:uncharacterized lipoprotein YddW (UPF0748 family)